MYVHICFLGPHLQHEEVPSLGIKSELFSCRPTPQPQQRQIQTMSVIYTTAHGSLTQLVRLGIQPAPSRMLIRFVSTAPLWELQEEEIFNHRISTWPQGKGQQPWVTKLKARRGWVYGSGWVPVWHWMVGSRVRSWAWWDSESSQVKRDLEAKKLDLDLKGGGPPRVALEP